MICNVFLFLTFSSNVIQEDLPDLVAWRIRFQKLFFEKNMARSLEKLKQDVSKGLSSI